LSEGSARGRSGRIGLHLLAAGRPEAAVEWLLAAAQVADVAGTLHEAMRYTDLAQRALVEGGVPDHDRRWGDTFKARSQILLSQARAAEARPWAERTARSAERHGWDDLIPVVLRMEATCANMMGDLDEGERLARLALAAAIRTDQPHVAVSALNCFGDVLRLRGDIQRAGSVYEQALGYRDQVSQLSNSLVEAMQGLALVRRHEGRLDEAAALFEEAHRHGERVASRSIIGHASNGLGEVARSRGRLDEAERWYRASIAAMRIMGSERAIVPRMNLALVLLQRRRFAEARALLVQARTTLRTLGRRILEACCGALVATCAAADRDAATFDEEIDAWVAFRSGVRFADADVAWALGLAGDLWARAGDGPRSRRAAEEARLGWEGVGRLKKRGA
jgi:tetratricopeptide (TPR) repeat protein